MPSSACSPALCSLPSIPTRRSSDLGRRVIACSVKRTRLNLMDPVHRIRHSPNATIRHCGISALQRAVNEKLHACDAHVVIRRRRDRRSEEHTSELQSPCNLVCRLLLAPPHSALSPLSLHDALPILAVALLPAASNARA